MKKTMVVFYILDANGLVHGGWLKRPDAVAYAKDTMGRVAYEICKMKIT